MSDNQIPASLAQLGRFSYFLTTNTGYQAEGDFNGIDPTQYQLVIAALDGKLGKAILDSLEKLDAASNIPGAPFAELQEVADILLSLVTAKPKVGADKSGIVIAS